MTEWNPRAEQFPPHIRVYRDGPKWATIDRPVATTPAEFAALVSHLRHEEQEVFCAIWLDERCRVIAWSELTRGTANATLVHPKEVFRTAIAAGAASIILLHNHPSGDLTPSAQDRANTRRLVAAGRLLGIPIHDHIIIAGDSELSLLQAGLLG